MANDAAIDDLKPTGTFDLLNTDDIEGATDKVVSDTEGGNVDILEDDKKDDDKVDDKKLEGKEGDKEDEEKEDEIKEEEIEIHAPPRAKEILAKYPNLFKDFPGLRNAYYREKQYTDLIPTIQDAKDLVERNREFDQLEKAVLGGDGSVILKSVKETDQKAFAKIVNNYLPDLQKADDKAYWHVIGTVIDRVVNSMVNESERLKNDDLKTAAALLYQFATGTTNYAAPKAFGGEIKEDDKKDETLQTERQQFMEERFNTVRDDLDTRTQNAIKSTLDIHIDPKGSMSPYVKSKAVDDCLSQVDDAIEQDTRFSKVLDGLWEQAFEANFSNESISRIRSAYLSKVKTLLPGIISNVRNSALKGASSDRREASQKRVERFTNREPAPSNDSGNVKKRKLTTFEELSRD